MDIHILFPLISDRCTFTIFALWKQDYIEYICNMCTRWVYIVSSISIQNVQFSMNFLFTISGTLQNGQRKISFLSWQFFMFSNEQRKGGMVWFWWTLREIIYKNFIYVLAGIFFLVQHVEMSDMIAVLHLENFVLLDTDLTDENTDKRRMFCL